MKINCLILGEDACINDQNIDFFPSSVPLKIHRHPVKSRMSFQESFARMLTGILFVKTFSREIDIQYLAISIFFLEFMGTLSVPKYFFDRLGSLQSFFPFLNLFAILSFFSGVLSM